MGYATANECYNEQFLTKKKIRMLQWARRNTIGRRSTGVTCRAFPFWLERQSLSLLSFVRFSYQFSLVICLLVQCVKVKYINFVLFLQLTFLILYYTFPVQMVVLDGNCAVGCGPAYNGLPLNTYISVYARTNRCYNERRLWAGLERITAKYIYFSVC